MPCCPAAEVVSKRRVRRIEDHEPAADVGRRLFRGGAGPDRAAGGTGRQMEAIVESPAERVEHRLARLVALEADVDDLADVRPVAARGRTAFEQVRHRADEDASLPAGDRDRGGQVVDERDRLVVEAVAVGVLEAFDRAAFLEGRIVVQVVLREFGDVEPAIFVEIDGDRRPDERLAGDELDAEARGEREGLDRVARLCRRHARQLVGAEEGAKQTISKWDGGSHRDFLTGYHPPYWNRPRSLARTRKRGTLRNRFSRRS